MFNTKYINFVSFSRRFKDKTDSVSYAFVVRDGHDTIRLLAHSPQRDKTSQINIKQIHNFDALTF